MEDRTVYYRSNAKTITHPLVDIEMLASINQKIIKKMKEGNHYEKKRNKEI